MLMTMTFWRRIKFLVWCLGSCPVNSTLALSQAANAKALKSGLTFRDLTQTVKDTHDWWYSDALSQARRDQFEQKAGSLLVNEERLLKRWQQTQSQD